MQEPLDAARGSERSMWSTFISMSLTYWIRALHKHPWLLLYNVFEHMPTECLNVNEDSNNSCSLMNLVEFDTNHKRSYAERLHFNSSCHVCMSRAAVIKHLSHETHMDWHGNLMLFFLSMEMAVNNNNTLLVLALFQHESVSVLLLPSAGETATQSLSNVNIWSQSVYIKNKPSPWTCIHTKMK